MYYSRAPGSADRNARRIWLIKSILICCLRQCAAQWRTLCSPCAMPSRADTRWPYEVTLHKPDCAPWGRVLTRPPITGLRTRCQQFRPPFRRRQVFRLQPVVVPASNRTRVNI